jgi:DNA-binding response OmpR family regulator
MRPPRVLVLEHHRDLREALVEALLDEGYVVTPTATLGAALLAMSSAGDEQLPDAVVFDTQDGSELLTEIRRERRYAKIALVTLSFAFDPLSDADADVRRPFRLDDLLTAVRGALQRRGFPMSDRSPRPGA